MEFFKKIFSKSETAQSAGTLPWINDLKGLDDISVIELVTQRLNSDLKNNLFKDEHYLESLFMVDEKTHTTVERITTHYINIDNISIELEERITQSVFFYHRQTFLTYFTFIQNLAITRHPSLLILLARAMYSATQMIKWRYYNYQSAPANVWLQISQLFKTAEEYELLTTNVASYEGEAETTLSTTYIQACMLGSLESLSFKRQQIDLVSRMLNRWAAKIVIEDNYDEKKHLFYVDTNNNVPAKRIRNFNPAKGYRYWSFDTFNSKIELCVSAIEFNISPKQLSLDEFIHNKHFLPTLEVLRTEWSRSDYKRQRRSEERTKTNKPATTAYGFEDSCYQIKQYENTQLQRGEKAYQGNKSFDERLVTHNVVKNRGETNIIYVDLGAGSSHIVDESGKGIGLHISKQANEVSLGLMVAVSVKEQKYGTRIGVIRSIKPLSGNQLHIGIEVLSRNAFCVEAKNESMNSVKLNVNANSVSDANSNFGSISSTFTCLFLPEEYGVSTDETLIVPRLQYNKNDVFKVNILGADLLVKLTEPLEKHEDWIRVSYSKDLA